MHRRISVVLLTLLYDGMQGGKGADGTDEKESGKVF